jgi:hypothetical protein
MNPVDLLGYLASLLVLATFCMRDMVPLRVMAIASNLAFIGYAALSGINPVLMLHVLLLPMNAYRLLEIMRQARLLAKRPDDTPRWERRSLDGRERRAALMTFHVERVDDQQRLRRSHADPHAAILARVHQCAEQRRRQRHADVEP